MCESFPFHFVFHFIYSLERLSVIFRSILSIHFIAGARTMDWPSHCTSLSLHNEVLHFIYHLKASFDSCNMRCFQRITNTSPVVYLQSENETILLSMLRPLSNFYKVVGFQLFLWMKTIIATFYKYFRASRYGA